MIDSAHYISEPYRGDPNAPTCQACGAVMVRSGTFSNVWVCLSCGKRVEDEDDDR
jgi:ribosomal protein L37AE/L43A